jgi:16S rRNA (guanine527-N7)-methyltransferase
MVSVDSAGKKIFFQRHILRTLNLQKIAAVHAKIEELHLIQQNKFSLIISRAFSQLDKYVSVAAPLLTAKGKIIALKGRNTEHEIAVCEKNLLLQGVAVTDVLHYSLPRSMGDRTLVIMEMCKAA